VDGRKIAAPLSASREFFARPQEPMGKAAVDYAAPT